MGSRYTDIGTLMMLAIEAERTAKDMKHRGDWYAARAFMIQSESYFDEALDLERDIQGRR